MKGDVQDILNLDMIRWQDQSLRDAVKWLQVHGNKHTERDIEAYRAGYMAGWRDAFSTLKLHGKVKP
jgi:hypothetical protein